MTIFQGVLLFSVIIFIIYVLRFKKTAYDRVFMLVIGVAGLILVVIPDLTTYIAEIVGIGRGTDLIFYTWVVFCLFKFLRYESRINNLERKITEITRHIAIEEAVKY